MVSKELANSDNYGIIRIDKKKSAGLVISLLVYVCTIYQEAACLNETGGFLIYNHYGGSMPQRLLLQMLFPFDFVITDHPAKQEKQRKGRYPYCFADDEITENCAGHCRSLRHKENTAA